MRVEEARNALHASGALAEISTRAEKTLQRLGTIASEHAAVYEEMARLARMCAGGSVDGRRLDDHTHEQTAAQFDKRAEQMHRVATIANT